MNRRTPLWQGPDLSVHRFDHPPGDHDHRPVDEIGTGFTASFVERGGFDIDVDGRRWRLGSGDVLLIHPGMRFRVSHPDGDLGDVCLSINYVDATDIGAQDLAISTPKQAWRAGAAPVIAANNRLRYLYWGLRRGIDDGTSLLTETCAVDLLHSLDGAHSTRPSVSRTHKPRTFDHYAQRVHAARERIDRDYAHDLRLGEIARDVGMSTFHFARLFAELIGTPPHRFLLDTRLRAAAAMLRDGRDVTETCFACGFNDPSHFGRVFSRRYGRTPSAYSSRPRQPRQPR